MASCPSCGAEISGGACKRCGARARTLDVPDLDLSAVTAPPPQVARRMSGQMTSVSDDVLAEDPGEASFELAIDPGDHSIPPGIVAAAPNSSPTLQNPPSSRSGGHAVVSAPPSNPDVRVSAPPVEEDRPRIDPLEAREFADYGESPKSALQTPLYAFKVKMRQSELRRGLWRAKLAFERAQKERSTAVADSSRLEEVKLRLAAEVEAKEREVDLHEAALDAFDHAALKRGLQIASATGAVLFLLVFLPIFFRMCIGVEAPPLNSP